MAADEDRRKHLEFIQNIITRMNTNSFQIKGLAVTLTTGLLAVYATKPNPLFIFLGILPTIFFWFLDSYYVQQERKFRGIYDDITGLTSTHTIPLYQMPVDLYNTGKFTFGSALRSKTITRVYVSIIGLLTIGGLIALFKDCI